MDNPIWNSEVEVLQSIYGNECVKQQSNNSIIIKLFLAQGLVELGVEVDQFYPVAIPKYNVKTYWPVAAADHGGFCQLEYSALKTINEKFLEIHSTACGEVIIFEWVEFLSKHLEAISPNQADTSDCVIIEAACSEEDNEVLNTRINDSSSYTKHTKKKPKSKLKSKKANNRPVAAFSTVNVKKAEEVLEEPKKSDKQIADVDLNLLLESDNVNNVVLVKEDFDRIALHKIDDEFKKELEKKKKLGADLVKLKISDKVEFSIIELIREQFKSNWSSVRPVDLNLLKDSFNTAPNSNQTNLFKTLNLNYLRFEKVGFTRDVIENIMWESWGTSFSDSLDWESENENDDSVNLQYAKLKIEEDNLKIKGGKNGRKLKQLKEKLELLTSNKDFNVKVANEEFQKLTKPFIDRTKKKSKRPEWEIEVKEKDEIEMGDFFEKEEANVSMTLQPSKCKTVVIKNFAIASSWTGKSPKQFLTDWLSKNAKGCKLAFSSLPTNAGHRIKAYLKGNIKDFENKVAIMEESEIVMTLKEAENYASTKLLYLLLPNLPIYRNLPPPFRELWLDLVKVDENLEIDEKEKLNSQRLSFLTKLYNFIQPKIQDKLKLSQNFGSNKENFEHVEREYSKKGGKLERRNEKFNSTFANCKSIFEMNKLNRFYKQLLFKRQTLPVFSQREKIIKACSENTFVIISGETGSGKSTQVPQFLLENSFEILKEANLICTQPRRISAISIASRVSEEMGEREIGMDKSLIGYSIRLESKISETTRLTFCTTGILLRRMEIDPYLEKITHVIVDEVHERSLESDFLLLLLKKLVKVRNDLTVVLMSATADSQKFYEYFFDAHTPCICVDVPGRTFPVTTMYLEDAIQDTSYLLEEYSEYAVYDNRKISTAKLNVTSKGGKSIQTTVQWSGSDSDDKDDFFASDDFSSNKYNINTINTLKRIDISKINLELIERLIFKLHVEGPVDMNGDRGSILVFLPGYGEIKRLYDVIASNADRNNMTVLPLHSSLNSNQQALVFKPSHSGFRKVILSTNIAETGVTIPDVTYVIDTVKSREVSYDIKRHVTKLSEVFISKANCLQRRGRAGRVREGICYHLVPSKFFFMSLLPQRQPEIMRLPLEELCLRIRAIGYKLPFSQFLSDALDIPPLENVARSVDELMSVGAMVLFMVVIFNFVFRMNLKI
ncbi:ATP-dependent RNA helicase dhx29 [Clydaea vesicula]|uniref:RNA helicase n=1 Tax=Clydaea vesicula TaxID=447962 RepID=A0AAD5U504_9FUNG|nr:ATP-dependent RNA helicase dhx29 [Clydaea vesicula]